MVLISILAKALFNRNALQYTEILSLKFMIQRCDHIDTHYTSALFKYLKELAIKFKDNT